jgi:hypothetical protein
MLTVTRPLSATVSAATRQVEFDRPQNRKTSTPVISARNSANSIVTPNGGATAHPPLTNNESFLWSRQNVNNPHILRRAHSAPTPIAHPHANAVALARQDSTASTSNSTLAGDNFLPDTALAHTVSPTVPRKKVSLFNNIRQVKKDASRYELLEKIKQALSDKNLGQLKKLKDTYPRSAVMVNAYLSARRDVNGLCIMTTDAKLSALFEKARLADPGVVTAIKYAVDQRIDLVKGQSIGRSPADSPERQAVNDWLESIPPKLESLSQRLEWITKRTSLDAGSREHLLTRLRSVSTSSSEA